MKRIRNIIVCIEFYIIFVIFLTGLTNIKCQSHEHREFRISGSGGNKEPRGIIQNPPIFMDIVSRGREAMKRLPMPDFRLPYSSYFSQVPKESVKLLLYNDPNDPTSHLEIFPEDENNLHQIRVPADTSVKMLIHGFSKNYNGSFPQKMKNAYLRHTPNPVIIVDWSNLAGDPTSPNFRPLTEPLLYFGIVDRNIPKVGGYLAQFIVNLKKFNVISSLDQVHIIGHSLGAHVSGEIGKIVQNILEGEKVGRITGLDPAGPHFGNKTFASRLDESDAKFVDVYHTSRLLGERRHSGHVDFFPNSELMTQPGCTMSSQFSIQNIASYLGAVTGSCDHHKAVVYYEESISNKGYFGCKFTPEDGPNKRLRRCSDVCDPEVVFGEHISQRSRGEYCVKIES